MSIPAVARFWRKVNTDTLSGCWLWEGAKSVEGYGLFTIRKPKMVRAHRYAWEALRGPIPSGQQLDHLCRVPTCVNPSHLEIVTTQENTLRGTGKSATNARKTECPQGHAYSWSEAKQRRVCKVCIRAQDKARRARQRAVPALRED
jgi:hypothetical protein